MGDIEVAVLLLHRILLVTLLVEHGAQMSAHFLASVILMEDAYEADATLGELHETRDEVLREDYIVEVGDQVDDAVNNDDAGVARLYSLRHDVKPLLVVCVTHREKDDIVCGKAVMFVKTGCAEHPAELREDSILRLLGVNVEDALIGVGLDAKRLAAGHRCCQQDHQEVGLACLRLACQRRDS